MFDLFLHTLAVTATVVWAYMTLWFFVSLIFKRNDVADIAWGIGFFVAAKTALALGGFESIRAIIVTLMVLVWGGRLSFHIFRRNKNKPEDKRYAIWRQTWGKWFVLRSYFQVFMLQGVLLMLVVSPVLVINTYRGSGITIFDIVGFVIWLIGFTFETVGDAQLKRFMKNPDNKGHIIQTGLWKYTRHPNYFGEVTQWWGMWIIALSVPYGWLGIIGPLTITFLILKVSGVPLLEKSFAGNPEFEAYKAKTSVFFPLPPRRG